MLLLHNFSNYWQFITFLVETRVSFEWVIAAGFVETSPLVIKFLIKVQVVVVVVVKVIAIGSSGIRSSSRLLLASVVVVVGIVVVESLRSLIVVKVAVESRIIIRTAVKLIIISNRIESWSESAAIVVESGAIKVPSKVPLLLIAIKVILRLVSAAIVLYQ